MHKSSILIPLSLLLVGADALSAQVRTRVSARTAAFSRDVGSTQNGINVRMNARVESRITTVGVLPVSGQYRAEGNITGRIRLFGSNREAVAASGFGRVSGSLQRTGLGASYGAGFNVRLGGQTVFSRSYSGSQNIDMAANRFFNFPIIQATDLSIPTPIAWRSRFHCRTAPGAR